MRPISVRRPGVSARRLGRRRRAALAEQAHSRDHPLRRRQRDRVCRASCSSSCRRSSASRSWSRTAGAGGPGAMVAKADPDGYTILVNSFAHTITPAIYANLSYDVMRDFATIAAIGNVPNVLIIAPRKVSRPSRSSWRQPRQSRAHSISPRSASARGSPQRRALPAERWLRGRAHSVQRRGRSSDRGDRRARRLLLLSDCHRPPAHPRRQAAGPRCQ